MVADEERVSKRAAGHGVATGFRVTLVIASNAVTTPVVATRVQGASLSKPGPGPGLGPKQLVANTRTSKRHLPQSVAGKGVCGYEGLCTPFTMGKAPFLRTGEWRPMATVLLMEVTCGLVCRPIISPGAVIRAKSKTRRLQGRAEKATQTVPRSQSESALSKGARTTDGVAATTPVLAT